MLIGVDPNLFFRTHTSLDVLNEVSIEMLSLGFSSVQSVRYFLLEPPFLRRENAPRRLKITSEWMTQRLEIC